MITLSRIRARLALLARGALISVLVGAAALTLVSGAHAAGSVPSPSPRTTGTGQTAPGDSPANLSATRGAPAVRYIVTYRPGVIPESQAAQIVSAGATPGRINAQLRSQVIAVSAVTSATVVDALRANPQVLSVSVDNVRSMASAPDDPGYAQQWALPRIGWDQVYGTLIPSGTSIVAVLDTGIDASHPDLAGSVVVGTSMIDGSDGQTDSTGHGTSLAGIIAARTNNATGIAGVGFAGVTVMPVTVLDADGVGYDSDIIEGITYATDQGANVILLAFSSPGFSPELQAAIDYAWNHGVLVVAATGNEGSPAPTYPAGGARVIGVSNTDQSDELHASSNYGLDTFLAAPGTGIYTTTAGGGYTTVTGTSASAALVAGSAALIRAIDPSLTNGAVAGRLARAADAAGTVAETGNGRLNLARAVADTSTESVTPAGSDGSGGPFVGPYVAASVSNTTFTGSSRLSGATTTWTVGFTPSAGGSRPTITVVFHSSFVIPATPTITIISGFANCAATGATVGTTVTITSANNGGNCQITVGTPLSFSIAGITNPAAGTYANTAFSVRTSLTGDTTAVSPATNVVITGTPTFTSITPSSRGQGLVSQDLAVVGTGFAAGAAVTFSGAGITVNSTTVNSATSLTVNITISGSAATGARSLTVTNPDFGTVTAAGAFTVNAVPTFTSVTPESLHQGATSQDLAVVGTGFAAGAAVTFSGAGIAVNSTTFNSATSLTVNVTVTGAAATGARSLTVTNTDGGTVTASAAFSVAAAPTLTSVTPSSRGQGATNQDLTIAGTGFEAGAVVTFSGAGITVNSTTFNSATSLTVNVTVAAGAAVGARDLTITNADAGAVTASGAFTVVAGPAFTSVTPSSRGQSATNQDLAVVGSGFEAGAARASR